MTEIMIATIMRPRGETGVQTHFTNLMEFLAQEQIPCRLITPFSYNRGAVYPTFALRKLIDPFSKSASVWWYRHWHAYFLYLALKNELRSGTDCVIYAQCPLSADAALKARVSEKQRVVMVTHFNVSQADEWAGKGLIASDGCLYRSIREFEANVLPRLDGLVYVSEFMRRELTNRIPALADIPYAVVPNFIADPGKPKVCPPTADLINIGTLEARKNQQYLLEIVAALREQGHTSTLTLVGDGPDRAMLEAKARELKIGDRVNFAGFVANAADMISSHKIYVHVATMESFGITLIEAMARGRPVYATAVGGVPEVLGGLRYGWSLPLDDAHAAAQIISIPVGNREWRYKLGRVVRERFLATYSTKAAAHSLLAFLQSFAE